MDVARTKFFPSVHESRNENRVQGSPRCNGTVTRDGKQFAVLLHIGSPQFAVEVELTDGALGEVRELSPEEAWQLARAGDATASPPIEIEAIDP